MRTAVYIIAIILGFPLTVRAKTIIVDLSEAIVKKLVTVDGHDINGRYLGKSLKLTVTNKSEHTLQLKVEPGIIFKPDSSEYQPLVLAGTALLLLEPAEAKSIETYAFCGNRPLHCPAANHHFSYSHMGSDTLVKVLQFIKTYSLYDYLGQSGIWTITNDGSLSSVYDESQEPIAKKFTEFIAKLTGRNMPEYYTVSQQEQIPDQPAYNPKSLKIIAQFEILLDSPKTLTLGVFDGKANMIQKVFEDQTFGRAGHRFGVEFESENVSPGKYYIMLKEGEKVVQQKMVEVE